MDTKTCVACDKEISAKASRCPYCRKRQQDTGLYRAHPGKMIGGVCAAIADQFDVDPIVVRLVFVVAFAITGGTALGVYALIWVLTPFRVGERAPAQRMIDAITRFGSSPASGQPMRDTQS